jgi:N-acyl-L-homoserine lactone synthetase
MDQANEEVLLTALDNFARQFVAMNEPLRFGVAQSQSEREAVYRLRYGEVIERGWSKPSDHPDGMERDKDDDEATQIVMWDGQTLAGTARLIFPVPDRSLPVETTYDIVIEPQHQVVYLSRVLVAPPYRGKGQHNLLLGLLGKSWIEIRARGFQHLCGVFAEAVMPTFQKVGVQIVPLGTPQDFLGEKRYACYIDMLQTAKSLGKNLK